jgi:hypothetical protein
MLRWVSLLAACSVGWATPLCVTTTLDNYLALGSGGCQIAGLTVTNFSYTYVSGNVIPDSDITVTPYTAAGIVGLEFSSNAFNVPIFNSSEYVLGYTWDPGDIRSLEDILNASSPVAPGFAEISTEDCEDAAFSGSTCSNSTDTIVVSDNGTSLNSPASVSFSSGVATLGILDTIDLDATAGGSSEFNYFDNQLTLPEPSTVVPCLLFAVLLLGRQRLQRV